MLITKPMMLDATEVYWQMCNRALRWLQEELPNYADIDVDEIHVDPDEDYVFVSYSYRKTVDSWIDHGSKTYRINKFLSLINKEEKVDPSDRIPWSWYERG